MSNRLIGYCRVSTIEQCLDAQRDQLAAAGCDVIFADHGASGSLTKRPELDRCLEALNQGDTLVVTRLDRLGRSAGHLATLIEGLSRRSVAFKSLAENLDTGSATGRLTLHLFAALAAFEKDVLIERTKAALAAKKRRGETLGRPRALKPSQVAAAVKMLQDGETPSHVARLFRVDRSTLHRAVARQKRTAA